MRVLQVCPLSGWGGIQTYVATLARLAPYYRGLSFEYAVASGTLLDERLQLEAGGIHRLGKFRLRHPWTIWRARHVLGELLSSGIYDAVICHQPTSMALLGPVVRRNGLPLIFYQHDWATGRHWIEQLARRVRPDLAICNSRHTASSLGAIYPRVPKEIIHYPAPPSEPAAFGEREATRSELATPRNAIVIIHAGRMVPWKGQALLLEALAKLRDVKGWVAWIVGGPQRAVEQRFFSSLQEKAKSLGLPNRVRFLGSRTDVARLMRSADIYSQPNEGHAEPFGLSFVEALRAGLPVVSTAVGGVLEIVDETCGLLVRPSSADALAQALTQLITDGNRRRTMAASARQRAQAFAPERRIEELAALLMRFHLEHQGKTGEAKGRSVVA